MAFKVMMDFFFFDADNVLDGEFFNKMNDAFIACDKKHAITSFRNSKNFGTNTLTALYGMSFITSCTIESRGRMALKSSSRILGSGFLVGSEMVKDGWNNVILSDDTDFTIEQVLQGQRVVYCDEAMYYDEHPTTLKAMWRQRLRWAKGAIVVLKHRAKNLFKNAFGFRKKDKKEENQKQLRGSSCDLIGCTLPIGAITFFLFIFNIILIALASIFVEDVSQIWINWAISTAITTGIGYVLFLISGICCYVKERHRIKGVSLGIKISSVILWPLFVVLLTPLQIVALFKRDVSWTPIEHKDTASHESFNDKILLNENEVKEKSK